MAALECDGIKADGGNSFIPFGWSDGASSFFSGAAAGTGRGLEGSWLLGGTEAGAGLACSFFSGAAGGAGGGLEGS